MSIVVLHRSISLSNMSKLEVIDVFPNYTESPPRVFKQMGRLNKIVHSRVRAQDKKSHVFCVYGTVTSNPRPVGRDLTYKSLVNGVLIPTLSATTLRIVNFF